MGEGERSENSFESRDDPEDLRDISLRRHQPNRAYQREQEANQRLREANEMKNMMLAAVSHDLRTPLSSLLGLARALEDQIDRLSIDQIKEVVRHIASSAQRLEQMVSSLLDLERLAAGALQPARAPTNIRSLIEGVSRGVDLEGRPLTIEADAVTVSVDGALTERIVENLLVNAKRHTPSGTPISIRALSKDEGVEIDIEDEGPGVLDEDKAAIFEPFHGAKSRAGGIGLSLVARFAEAHGGRAWVEDRTGGGASFRVLLPDGEPKVASTPVRPD
jgi:two-component system sensor histidine kinase KdpD